MTKKEKNIKEVSAMALGAAEFGAQKRKMPKEYYTERKQFIKELRLRKIIQETIKNFKKEENLEKERLQSIIKNIN